MSRCLGLSVPCGSAPSPVVGALHAPCEQGRQEPDDAMRGCLSPRTCPPELLEGRVPLRPFNRALPHPVKHGFESGTHGSGWSRPASVLIFRIRKSSFACMCGDPLFLVLSHQQPTSSAKEPILSRKGAELAEKNMPRCLLPFTTVSARDLPDSFLPSWRLRGFA